MWLQGISSCLPDFFASHPLDVKYTVYHTSTTPAKSIQKPILKVTTLNPPYEEELGNRALWAVLKFPAVFHLASLPSLVDTLSLHRAAHGDGKDFKNGTGSVLLYSPNPVMGDWDLFFWDDQWSLKAALSFVLQQPKAAAKD